MGIDPELQALLEDLRTGYGDATDVPEDDENESAAARRRDWALRSGYAMKSVDHQPSSSI